MKKPSYIELVNQFWKVDLEYQFTHLDVHLYFRLLFINNSLGWKSTFRYANSRLIGDIKTTEKGLINSRNKLVEAGVLRYTKGQPKQAGMYDLLSFFEIKESDKVGNASVKEAVLYRKDKEKKFNDRYAKRIKTVG